MSSSAGASDLDELTADDRRRLRRAWWTGAVPVLAAFAWVAMVGRWAPLRRQFFFDEFFDTQARSFFGGRLAVDPAVVSFEGFRVDDQVYIYFGPLPSIVRMPLLAVTDRFDGRLTVLSMVAAMAVLMAFAFRLSGALRGMLRGSVPVGPRELWATGALAVAVAAGPPFFLASLGVVYHEAAAWGLALTVGGLDAVARWQRRPTGRRLALASGLVTAAMLSRVSVALGALAALAVTAAMHLVRRWRDDPQARRHLLQRTVPALALAGVVPLGTFAALNQAKFGEPFGPPLDRHIQTLGGDPDRAAALAANPNLVGFEYLSTTARQYLGPDGVALRRDFPWLDFPRDGPRLMNPDAVFDELDWTSSIPASAPALTALTLAGGAWAIWRRRDRGHAERLTPLWVGAAASGATVLVFGFVANRYLSDVYPVAIVGGLVGFHAAARLSPRLRPWSRRAVMGALGTLVAFGALVNLALALEYQRERGPAIPEQRRADWVSTRVGLPGSPEPLSVAAGEPLPPAADGDLAVVGECGGLYVAVGDAWWGVERGPGVGVFDLTVDLERLPPGGRFPLASFGEGDQSTVVGLTRLTRDGRDEVRIDILPPGGTERSWLNGSPAPLSNPVTIRASVDPRQDTSFVEHDGRALNVTQLATHLDASAVSFGSAGRRPGVAPVLPGGVTVERPDQAICRTATGQNR